jgi:hypothetical protein
MCDWPDQDFQGLLAKLKRQFKAAIPVAERDDWEAYFNARKAEVAALTAEIDGAEAEINDRVYRLFGLTGDDVKLIEDAIAGRH